MASAAPVTEAAPAAPSAAPPSAPSAGGGSADRSPDDVIESLRQDTIAWGHNYGKPQDAPADAPSEPNSEAPAVQQAEGSTPPTEAPATAAPSSAHQDWIKQYGGDPDQAGQEAFALQKRVSEMARKLKEYESAQPAPAPAVPQVATPVAPAPTPQAPTPQAQPAQPTATPTVHEQALEYALTNDAQCRDLLGQYNKNAADLKALYDPQTGAGEIPTLQEEIRKAQTLIDHPSVDELVKDEARQVLRSAQGTLSAKKADAAALRLTNKELDIDFRARINGYVGQLESQSAERAREADFEKEAEAKAQEFVGQWPTVFDTVFKEQGIDPEMRADIHEAVKEKALARPGRIDLKDLKTFMDEAIKAEFNKVDKYHRIQARQHALKKTADTAPAAPTNAVAATAPPTSQTEDPEAVLERLRLGTRQAFRARGAR